MHRIQYERPYQSIQQLDMLYHKVSSLIHHLSEKERLDLDLVRDEIQILHKASRDKVTEQALTVANALSNLLTRVIVNSGQGSANVFSDHAAAVSHVIQQLSMIRLQELRASQISQDDILNLKELLSDQQQTIVAQSEDLESRVNNIESVLINKLKNVEKTEAAVTEQMNTLLANAQNVADSAANTLIYKDYQSSASTERTLSDNYRRYSILTMIAAAALPVFSVLEHALFHSIIELNEIIIRSTLSILLSLPAAYFARESAKHRRQQYIYQQYFLTLNALPLYIAEFDKEEKNKIKAEIAKIIFTSSHDYSSTTPASIESQPVNLQELLVLLISKMDIKK